MAVKPIVTVWNENKINKKNIKFLTDPTVSVEFPLSNLDKEIIQDLKDSADSIPCAGIAANQIRYSKKIFIAQADLYSNSYEIFINPTIKKYFEDSLILPFEEGGQKDNTVTENCSELLVEGCLSIPGYDMIFPRYNKIEVEYYKESGEKVNELRKGFMAIVFQHETDHLNGMTIAGRFLEGLRDKQSSVMSEVEKREIFKLDREKLEIIENIKECETEGDLNQSFIDESYKKFDLLLGEIVNLTK